MSTKSDSAGKLSYGPGSQNPLLEKVTARTSTPDSEALASSEDEADLRYDNSAAAQQARPTRRPSWLNDTSQPLPRPRKGSFASNTMSSPAASHPSTPSAETASGPWGSQSASSAMPRSSGSTAFSWGTGIWNNDRKDPPSRLQEVLPSPTSTVPPGSANNSFFPADAGLSSPSRDHSNSQIPFAIPLHPTPKTYRSQSYSVGQLEPENPPSSGMSSSTIMGRARHPALQHRPSRPSMLSEMANDGSVLGKVKEVEDDEDEDDSGSMQGSFHQSSADAKTIEMLARENAMLRQQQQHYNARMRPRASTGASYLPNGYPLHESVPEESDYAVDELDENQDPGDPLSRRSTGRRMSEFGTNTYRSTLGMDSRRPENPHLKKALWSSSPGFFGGDASQSRRHSFANMPTRQGSVSSVADSVGGMETPIAEAPNAHQFGPGYHDAGAMFSQGANFGNPLQTNAGPYMQQLGGTGQFPNRASSPPRGMYGIGQPRHNQLLHIVLFKCARADVFYIQEGTGLTVKPGDLVIVEADRGTDLGTVAKDNVDWHAAKELKEHYAEEQYKWLMMYSQGAAASEGTGGLLAAANGLPGSAVGGMGPPSQHHAQEQNPGELRPKMIKRLAQNHEVHALRDKEGQEAKAKRVCMQKVKEHGLNMEILDAEFQMDWKKLTFYYFADAYINFNSLVTDLFKIYKTRIWMSAINPASFASPTLGIQAPSGVGPGAVGVNRGQGNSDRRTNQPPPEQHPAQAISPGPQGRGFRPGPPGPGGFHQPGVDRHVSPVSAGGYPPNNYAFGPAGAFGNARPQGPYAAGLQPGMEGFHAGFPQAGDFPPVRQRFHPQQPDGGMLPHARRMSPMASQGDWQTSFQGLSLNSH